MLGGWGLTEPGSGSDAGAARARAVRDGDGWLLNGTKTFITQGSVGEIYVVLASTAPELRAKGLTAFIVERGTPGFRTGKRIEKMGLHASDTTELVLEDVARARIAAPGRAEPGLLRHAARSWTRGASASAPGRWASAAPRMEAARRYAKERVQFGKPIAEFQAIQYMLADMATELDAARLLVWRAALLQDQQPAHHARVVGREVLRRARRRCAPATTPIQIHGGYGYTREFDVERYLRDAKLAEIGEGTNEVQKMVIAREILKEAAGA